jgi:acetolactate synthase-1/2/3 large subunit
MTIMTGGAALVQTLANNGVDTVFGLPGVQADHVFDALYHQRESMRVVTSRHEQGAAYMAYGYAQSTGRLGAYVVVPGPGLLNTATPLCIAHSSNAPVLAMTAQIATQYAGRGLGVLHEIPNTASMFAPFTKHQGFADHPTKVPLVLNECVRQAMSGRRGAVLFEVPEDATALRAEVVLGGAAGREPDPMPDPDLIAKAAALLGAAERPALFVGGGAAEAGEAVRALAEALEAPVIMSRHGRGVLSDRHPLAQTGLGGHALWPDVDVILVVGTRFLDADAWGTDSRLKVIRVDIDATQATRPFNADLCIVGDARTSLTSIFNALGPHNRKRTSRKDEMETVRQAGLKKFSALEPQKAYSDAMRAALPDDGITVCDVTQLAFYMRMGFPVYAPRTQIFSGFQDSLGYGFATALGVKVAHPDRAVVCVSGDGGFMFTMPEMASAVKHGINLVTVLFNDNAFGNVRRIQKMQYGERYIGCDLSNPDFMKLADSFGIVGMRVTSPQELQAALPKALGAGAPVLIEVPVGPMPAWQPLMPRSRARRSMA